MSLSTEYVAGLFDGEGYITVTYYEAETFKYTRCQIKVGITLTYRPVIEILAAQFGGVLSVNPSAFKKNPVNRVAFGWIIASQRANQFLRLVTPLLIIKRDQAVLALELQSHINEHFHFMRYTRGPSDKRTEILAHRRDVVARIKALKKERFPLVVRDPMPAVG